MSPQSFHVVLNKGSITLQPSGSQGASSSSEPVVLRYDEDSPRGYEGKLDYYLSNGEKSETRWYSCSKCHIFVFTTFPTPDNVKVGCTVSLRTLDYSGSGTSLKELTRSDSVRYDDMQSEVERNRHNEPFEGGEW